MKKQEFTDFLNSRTTAEKAEFLTSLGIAATTDETLATNITEKTRMMEAMSGDMVFVCTPATVDTAVSFAISRTVTIELQNAAGDVHTWFNKTVANGLTLTETTNGDGVVSFASDENNQTADAEFVDGVATDVVYNRLTWAAADEDTLTMAETVILGYTIAAATSVETIIADE